jgi:hypothetical protein
VQRRKLSKYARDARVFAFFALMQISGVASWVDTTMDDFCGHERNVYNIVCADNNDASPSRLKYRHVRLAKFGGGVRNRALLPSA